MTKITFVSAADSRYYPMLRELIHSLRAFKQSAEMDICIMDVGLDPQQVEELKPLVARIFKPDFPFPIHRWKIRGREYLKACICRPFLPDLLPEYDLYFWIDSDAWLQRWDGVIDVFLKGAERGKIALTGQVDRAYPRQVRVKWLGRWPLKIKGFYMNNVRPAFGFRAAKKIMSSHVLMAGAFALRKDAPHWKRWQELSRKAAFWGKVFTAEQAALGVLCHLEGYGFELLPAWMHWACGGVHPLWDEENQKFVERYLPHEVIGIVAVTGSAEVRTNRAEVVEFETLQDNTLFMSYRYPAFDGERGVEIVHSLPSAHDVPRGALRIAGQSDF